MNLIYMKRILILFAHPAFHKSRVNKMLVDAIKDVKGVTFNDLYENYPDFYIDVNREKRLLVEHDIIIWQHPFYWYSSPALLKEWMDLVLEHGFAYGIKGRELEGKSVLSVISTGGRKEVYTAGGGNRYTIKQFLVPFKQSVNLCRMEYLPPFVIYGSHTISRDEIEHYAHIYKELIVSLRDKKIDDKLYGKIDYFNDIF